MLQFLYPGAIWDFSDSEKQIYITFDDGPNPETTPLILDILKKENVLATFFCLGEQVKKHPELFQQIKDAGHTIGNHSMTHPNGFRTKNDIYLKDVLAAKEYISSKLFRAPYGRLKPSQYKLLRKEGFIPVFWTIVSFDFDQRLAAEKYVNKMIRYAKSGSIYVFHDNPKAKKPTELHLAQIIERIKNKGYSFSRIEPELFS